MAKLPKDYLDIEKYNDEDEIEEYDADIEKYDDDEEYDADEIEEAEKQKIREEQERAERQARREQVLADRKRIGEENLAELVKLHNDGFDSFSPENIIGKRVKHLRDIYGFKSPTDFSRKAGINRTTLYHCEKGDSPIKISTVRKIIAGFDMDVYDFAYSPKKYDDFVEHHKITEDTLFDVPKNIFDFRDYVLNSVQSLNFSYNVNGIMKRVPVKYVLTLKKLLESSFEVLDLMTHDL